MVFIGSFNGIFRVCLKEKNICEFSYNSISPPHCLELLLLLLPFLIFMLMKHSLLSMKRIFCSAIVVITMEILKIQMREKKKIPF